MDVLFLFEWFDSSMLASVSKSYGGVFAMVQTVHLGAMALLGGMILALDLRLLNIVLRSVDADVVVRNTYTWINVALALMLLSGIFMSSAVAIKLYYNMFFWAKMAAFSMGLIFIYAVKMPLLRHGVANLGPGSVRCVAIASIVIWFSVAACGRWIGFS